MKNHYVYQIKDRETDQFYIGSRSCECEPEKDSYMGSPCAWEPNEENLDKYILFKGFSDRDTAFAVERATIKEFINDDLNENYHIPSEGFHTLGRSLTEEHKQAISDYFSDPHNQCNYFQGKLGKDHITSKPVLQFDLEGNFIKEWENGRQVMREYGYSPSNIYMCCRGEYDQSNGYIWRYKYDGEGNEFDKNSVEKYHNTGYKKVYQFDKLTGELLNEYESVAEAGRQTGNAANGIGEVCKEDGDQKTCGGYLWSYTKEIDLNEYRNTNVAKPVAKLDVDTDEVLETYDSMTEAANDVGVSMSNICVVCSGKRNVSAGYNWRYLWDV